MLFLCISLLCVKPTHQVSYLLFLSNIAQWLDCSSCCWEYHKVKVLARPAVSCSLCWHSERIPEYQIVCLFAFPCHLVISAGIILYWLSYLRPSHSSRRLPLPGSDLHAGLPSIHMQRGSLRIPQFSELRHPLVVLTYWQVAIDCWL